MTTLVLTHLAAAVVGGAVWSALVLIICKWLQRTLDEDDVEDDARPVWAGTSTSVGRADWERWRIGRRT